MSGLSAKRQRANTDGDSVPSSIDYNEIIKTFDSETMRELLSWAASKSDQNGKEIIHRRNAIMKAESDKVIDFDHYSKRVWHELAKGDRLPGSSGYEYGLDVGWSISSTIKTICGDAPAHSSFGTKKSALVTLRKIGKSVALSGHSAMGSEVTNMLQQEGSMEKAMLTIIHGMSGAEKSAMSRDSEWVSKMKELKTLGSVHNDLFRGLDRVLREVGAGDAYGGDDGDEEDASDGSGGDDDEDGEEDSAGSEGDEDTEEGAMVEPRRNMCRGCGCGNQKCSSCWGD